MENKIDHIIKTYRSSICKICLGYAPTLEDAEDLLQESLINIWKGLATFRKEATLKTWVYRITVNTCLLSLRKKRVKTVELDPITLNRLSSGHTSPAMHNEQFQKLHRLIQQLSEKDKLIILLYLEEVSQQDIAQIIGLTASNVGVRIHRIKKQLITKFKSHA